MSYVIAAPEMMTSAAADLATIGSNVSAAHMVAAARTTAVIPAAADEVSTGIAALFSQHAANYQAMAAQAAAFNDQFVQRLTAGAFTYADIEARLARFLQNLPADANLFVSFIATTPPHWLLFFLFGGLLALISSPIWLPVAGIGLLVFLIWLRTVQITIMLGGPTGLLINGIPVF
jgi:hypothetical protein